MTRRALLALILALLVGAAFAGCGDASKPVVRIRLATTTSFRDTGLADVLLAAFRDETGIRVDPIAVGTGEALKLGERGDADVVLVHARKAEDEFLAKGFGVVRHDVWWNRFVLLGPPDDPAHVRGATDAAGAFRRIGAANAPYVSRGDDSGTHKREVSLRGSLPTGAGYVETGQGQGPTLLVAAEKRAYVLSDEGTWLRMRERLALVPVLAGVKGLENPYGVLVVRPEPAGAARHEAARRFAAWLVGERARDLVRTFRVGGARAFFLPGEVPPTDAR